MEDRRGEAEADRPQKPLRIGVLCEASGLSAWQLECLAQVRQLPFAEIVLFIRNVDRRERPGGGGLRTKLADPRLPWRMYERLVVERRSAAQKVVPATETLQDAPSIDVEPVRVGKFRQSFDDAALDAVRGYQLDVLLRFGFGILTGGILDVPRYGIWSFHHGDPEHFRGAPAGFWEVHNGAPVTGVILQRLTEKLDAGVVLHSGWFRTNRAWYSRSLDRILFGAAHFVPRALTELWRNPEKLMNQGPLKSSGPIYRYPTRLAMLRFFARTAATIITNQLKALFVHQQWSVGVINKSREEVYQGLNSARQRVDGVTWLQEKPNAFLADPFPVEISGETRIIAEEFDWKTGLGGISILRLAGSQHSPPQPPIQSRYHLSYPYTFQHLGQTYCSPECAESDGVALYRLSPNDGRCLDDNRIISGFPAVDPTIFRHDGRWWLFCTSAEAGADEVLYAFFADDLMGEWLPHQLNPVKVDIRGARPAGPPFMSEGSLIRPAQDCSRTYGGAITFNRIVTLTPEDFVEEPAGQLLPCMGRYSAALHTFSGSGAQTIVDGARLTFVPAQFLRTIRKKNPLARGKRTSSALSAQPVEQGAS